MFDCIIFFINRFSIRDIYTLKKSFINIHIDVLKVILDSISNNKQSFIMYRNQALMLCLLLLRIIDREPDSFFSRNLLNIAFADLLVITHFSTVVVLKHDFGYILPVQVFQRHIEHIDIMCVSIADRLRIIVDVCRLIL